MPVRRSAALAVVLALLAVAAAPLSAQWPRHRSASAPRTAAGAVDVRAPAPRTRAGTPDLSGLWENVGWRELQQQSGDVSGTGGSPGTRGLLGGATGVLTGGPGLFFDIATGVCTLGPCIGESLTRIELLTLEDEAVGFDLAAFPIDLNENHHAS